MIDPEQEEKDFDRYVDNVILPEREDNKLKGDVMVITIKNEGDNRTNYVGMSMGAIVVNVGYKTYKQHYTYKTSDKENQIKAFIEAFEAMSKILKES